MLDTMLGIFSAYMRKPPAGGRGVFKKSGGDLLSQGGTPKYHRRWWA